MSAPPGPVAAETIRRGLGGGFRSALRVQLGSIIGDTLWLVAAFLGLAPLLQIAAVRAVLALAGVGVLLYFGVSGLRDAWRFAGIRFVPLQMQRGAFRSGIAIAAMNPMTLAFWLSVGGALFAAGVTGDTPAGMTWFVGGFFAGVLAWAIFMATAVSWARRAINSNMLRIASGISGAALIVFAVLLALRLFAA